MNTEHTAPNLTPRSKTDEPLSLRIILANADGNAIGTPEDYHADTCGVAVTSMPTGRAVSPRYGIAYASNDGTAKAGTLGAAVVHNGGCADAGDGGMAYAFLGSASVDLKGVAFAIRGQSKVGYDGVAVIHSEGSAGVTGAGVACALNFATKLVPSLGSGPREILITDSTVGKVSGGKDSVVVAFKSEHETGTPRTPVVGIIGERPAFLDRVLKDFGIDLEPLLLASGVQFGLKAGQLYSLSPATGGFA